jgi:hypothetical protein
VKNTLRGNAHRMIAPNHEKNAQRFYSSAKIREPSLLPEMFRNQNSSRDQTDPNPILDTHPNCVPN